MRISDLKISISGIRGIVGQNLTPQLLIKFSEAFSTYIGGGRIALASDTRPSAEMVRYAVLAGLLSCGAQPLDLGILPIPTLQIYTRDQKLKGAVSITASHNPIEWNALKLIRKGGSFLSPYEAEELLDFYYQGRFKRIGRPETIRHDPAAFAIHQAKITAFTDIAAIRRRRPRVVVDPCAGAATPYVKTFLQHLGAEVHCIHCDLGRGFPRNPEPLAENLGALGAAVKKTGADVGFAQDADADRLAVVDENGVAIGEEYTLALAVDYYLSARRKTPVVVNLSTSRVIEDIAARHAVPWHRARVGEINVARKMQQCEAGIGGEGNGGVIVSDIHTCRDSFGGMALILEHLARSGQTISTLKSRLPHYVIIKEKIEASFRERKRILEQLGQTFNDGRIDKTDGLRIEYDDFWLHVRPSNTEPVIRIVVEARERKAALRIFERIKQHVLGPSV